MENSKKTLVYGKQKGLLTNAEKASPLGYYFAIAIIMLVAGIYAIMNLGMNPDKTAMLAVSDSLLVVGTVMFLFTSLYGYIKAKHLRIQDSMFAFSMASLSFCIAGIVWTWNNLQGITAFPSLADVFFLVGSLALIGAIYSATRAISETSGLKVELNAIISDPGSGRDGSHRLDIRLFHGHSQERHDPDGVDLHSVPFVRHHLPGARG